MHTDIFPRDPTLLYSVPDLCSCLNSLKIKIISGIPFETVKERNIFSLSGKKNI